MVNFWEVFKECPLQMAFPPINNDDYIDIKITTIKCQTRNASSKRKSSSISMEKMMKAHSIQKNEQCILFKFTYLKNSIPINGGRY